MVLLADDIRAVFWVATIPAFIAVAILIFAVKEPESGAAEGHTRSPIHLTDLLRVDAAYWWLVLIAAVLTLARFSEAFLVLRAENVGLCLRCPIGVAPNRFLAHV
ncbi:MAG: hypothetical protein IH789_13160, partial [Acidobacteria bacterium]|nr:hypothetical protein [Acidobacteriota bacterium]